MNEWIPLFAALVWPPFAAILLIWGRSAVGSLIEAAADRIRKGASVEVGPSGLKLGQGQSTTAAPQVEADTRKKDDLPHDIYLRAGSQSY